MIGPLFTYWSKMDTLIFTVGPGASPCNATIIWQHKHMSKLHCCIEIYKTSKYDWDQQYEQSIRNNEKPRLFIFCVFTFFCVPSSSRRKSTNTMLLQQSRPCPHIPCCPSYIPMKLIDSPMLCFNRTIQVWPFLLLCTVFTCCATSPPDAPTYIQRTNQ